MSASIEDNGHGALSSKKGPMDGKKLICAFLDTKGVLKIIRHKRRLERNVEHVFDLVRGLSWALDRMVVHI